MNERKNNEKINLSELINEAARQDHIEETEVEDMWEGEEVEEETSAFEAYLNEDVDPEAGGGMVIEKPTDEEKYNPLDMSKLNPETMNRVNNYLDQMNKDIEIYEESFGDDMREREKNINGGIDEDELVERDEEDDLIDRETDEGTFREKYDEAVVIIDKTGMGSVVNFTTDEREKLEKVKKIKLEEVEVIEVPKFKTKRAKKGSAKKILNKINTTRSTPIVLPVSGITMDVTGCSTYELLTLLNNDRENLVESQRSKWSLLHSKVLNTSIGKMDFDTFLNNVAQMEYDIIVYGVLCATYPEVDKFPLSCPKCKNRFTHEYEVRTLLRAEEITEKMMAEIQKTVENSYTEEDAKECHSNSLLNTVETIRLPQSGYLFTIGVQSAHEFIDNSMETIADIEEKYNQSAILASAVKAVYIEDPDDGEYYQLEDQMDIIETIYSLYDTDLLVLGQKIGKLVEGMNYTFGLMDITCDNPKCKSHTNTIAIELEDILFHKYQQVMNTNIE